MRRSCHGHACKDHTSEETTARRLDGNTIARLRRLAPRRAARPPRAAPSRVDAIARATHGDHARRSGERAARMDTRRSRADTPRWRRAPARRAQSREPRPPRLVVELDPAAYEPNAYVEALTVDGVQAAVV